MKILIFFTLFTSLVSWAGPRVTGNGGDVVVCRDQEQKIKHIELLDYFEARAERGINVDLDAKKDVQELVNIMIKRLEHHEQGLARFVAHHVANFQQEARLIPNIELVDIPDSQHTSFPKDCRVEQIAIQALPRFKQDPYYKINKELWDGLDNISKAGLILHEVIYRVYIEHSQNSTDVNSIGVRYVNSLAAANLIQKMTIQDYLRNVLQNLNIRIIEIQGILVEIENIKLHKEKIYSFCGFAIARKPISVLSPFKFQVVIAKNSKVCVTTSDPNSIHYKISHIEEAPEIHYQNLTIVPAPYDMSFIIKGGKRLESLDVGGGIEVHFLQGGVRKLFCTDLYFNPEKNMPLVCNTYYADYQLLSPMGFSVADQLEVAFKAQTTIQSGVLQEILYYASSDRIRSQLYTSLKFYPSGYLQSIETANGFDKLMWRTSQLPLQTQSVLGNTAISFQIMTFYDGLPHMPSAIVTGKKQYQLDRQGNIR